MCCVTVLSPHLDDAAFSLGLSLSAWSERKLDLQVINFFTVSGYAPHCVSKDPAVVSAVREREDRRALTVISPNISVESLHLLDAPLRFGLPVGSLFTLEVASGEVQALKSRVSPRLHRGAVIAPLGLGNHIDHLTVRALATAEGRKDLAFYEDLPYAAWTDEGARRERVQEVEQITHVRLRPVIVRRPHAITAKRRIVSLYQSQLDRDEAGLIAQFASNYGGGERIWVLTPTSRRTAILSRSK